MRIERFNDLTNEKLQWSSYNDEDKAVEISKKFISDPEFLNAVKIPKWIRKYVINNNIDLGGLMKLSKKKIDDKMKETPIKESFWDYFMYIFIFITVGLGVLASAPIAISLLKRYGFSHDSNNSMLSIICGVFLAIGILCYVSVNELDPMNPLSRSYKIDKEVAIDSSHYVNIVYSDGHKVRVQIDKFTYDSINTKVMKEEDIEKMINKKYYDKNEKFRYI